MSANILLVDDDEMYRYGFRRACRGVEEISDVMVACDGKEAMELLVERLETHETLPTHIFLDITMPVMDGVEFLEKYKHLETLYDGNVNTQVIVLLSSAAHASDSNPAIASLKKLKMRHRFMVKQAGLSEASQLIRESVTGDDA